MLMARRTTATKIRIQKSDERQDGIPTPAQRQSHQGWCCSQTGEEVGVVEICDKQ